MIFIEFVLKSSVALINNRVCTSSVANILNAQIFSTWIVEVLMFLLFLLNHLKWLK